MAVALAALVMLQMVVLGANGPLLASVAAVLNVAVALLVLFVATPDLRFWRGAAPVLACVLAMAVWVALPGIVPSLAAHRPAPDLFLPGLARFLGGSALFIAAGMVGFRRSLLRVSVDWLIIFGFCQILIGLALREADPNTVWGMDKTIDFARYTGTMINANANATATGVVALLALGRMQVFMRTGPSETLRTGLLRLACMCTVIMALGVEIISGSRTVLVLTAVSIVGLIALDPLLRRWLHGWRLAVLLIGGVMMAGLLYSFADGTTLHRFRTLGVDGLDRAMIWNHYADLAAQAPRFGYGPSAFTEMNQATIHTPFDAAKFGYIHSAHNEPLELMLEGGVIFAALTLITGVATLWTIVRAGFRKRDDPLMRSIPAAFLVILFEALVDIALDVPAVAALSAMLLGLLWGRSIRVRSDSLPSPA